MWRLAMLFQIIPALAHIFLSLLVFRDIDLPTNLLSMEKEGETRKILRSYMKETQATFMIKNYNEILEKEKQQSEKTKGRKCGNIRFLFTYYNKEAIYGIILGLVTAFGMLNSYLQFQLTLIVKDDDNDDELQTAKLLSAFIVLFLIIFKFINIVSNLNKYRKMNYLIGHGIMGLNWLGMGISYYFDSFTFPKFCGFIFVAACGLSFDTTYYTMMAEVCGANLVFISFLAYLLGNFLICFIAPYILTSHQSYGYWCLGNGVICLSCTIFCYFYLIETQGLEKGDIFDL